jgi:phosphoenolpyruvate carboxylase
MNRHIPATMATQHPDNAWTPYWEKGGDGFISTREETEECYSAFKDLGCEEFLWDWEGKYVDEAVVDRLFHTYHDYFKKNQLGRDKFLTFRIPNIWHERGYGLARAMMGILTAEAYAKDLGFHTPPLFEVILPLTDKAEDMIYIQDTFMKLATFKHKLFKDGNDLTYLNVIPLFESVENLLDSRTLLDRYVTLHKRRFKGKPEYLRLHLARSDPALNSGLVAAVVADKIALSEFYRFSEDHDIPVYPAIGVGTLPFRGSLSPERINYFIEEFPGVRTAYIQSAFRYDFPLPVVKNAIAELNAKLPHTVAERFDVPARRAAEEICSVFAAEYRRTVENLAPMIHALSTQVPQRRERKLHTGLFGYSRGIGKKKLPRAIPFTAVLYSLGVPPEFFGTGRGLEAAARKGLSPETFYRHLRKDLDFAGRCLNRKNLDGLSRWNPFWAGVRKDIELVEKHLGVTLGPVDREDHLHESITSAVYRNFRAGKPISEEIIESGKIRRSLG